MSTQNNMGFLNKIKNATDFIQAKSIAEMARRNIFMYRVGISQSVSDVKVAIAINKYIETMCCIFTMIVSGINPLVKSNNDIDDIIEKISAENYDPRDISIENLAIIKDIKRLSIEYDGVGRDPVLPRIGKGARSTEASSSLILDPTGKPFESSDSPGSKNKNVVEKWPIDPKFAEKLEKYPAYPTILKITFNIQGNELTVPIAVKANPIAIGSEEMVMFMESVLSGRSFNFIRYFKWKSGEINTLEYVLGTDVAERDKKLYQSLGRNPIYMEFLKRKAKSRINGISNYLSKQGKENTIGPTGSLIVTSDDLVQATNLDISRFTKNNDLIQKIMDRTFIMCFGIVDMAMEVVSFYFMGYKEPFRINFGELGVGTSINSDKQLETAILELSRKVA